MAKQLTKQENDRLYFDLIRKQEKEGIVKRSKDSKNEHWDYTPIQSPFLHVLYDLYVEGALTLLDIGAGHGNVLQYARNIGFDAYGIEEKNDYVNKDDAKQLAINYSGYDIGKELSKFDVVYCYKPIGAGFDTMVSDIITHMKAGAWLIVPDYFIDLKKETRVIGTKDKFTYQKPTQAK